MIMRDPYIDPDGHNYEREAIITWLSDVTISLLPPLLPLPASLISFFFSS